jgi:hypothetical protein
VRSGPRPDADAHRPAGDPHLDFNFGRIRGYWREKLDSYAAAAAYLEAVDTRLQKWLRELGPWIDFDFAVTRLQEDLELQQVRSHLTWLAFRHRLRLANDQRKRLSRDPSWRDEDIRVEVAVSADGMHDAVWHEDFRCLYVKAMEKERRELKRLRETGALSSPAEGSSST